MNVLSSRTILGVALLGFISPGAQADTYVVPPANAGASGSGGTFSLLTVAYTGQQVYSSNLLSGLPVGAVIDGFRFRLAPGQATVTTAVSSANFDISMGPSVFNPGSLSSTTASNQGPGTVLVRSGPITFAANSFIGGAGPNPFGPLIAFTTPYTYTGGPLLLTFSDTAFSQTVTFDAQANLFSNAQGRQNVGVFNSSTVPQNVDGFAMILQFNYSFNPVPEPSTFALCGLAVLACLAVRRQVPATAAKGEVS